MPEAPTISVPIARAAKDATGLVLRIRGTAHDGRLIKITAATCTIGSDSDCTLRLRSPGVDPLHCVLSQESGRTIARSRSVNTELNGQPFEESKLRLGDRLTIGPIQLEVVDGAEEAATSRTSSAKGSLDTDHGPGAQSLGIQTADLVSERQRLQAETARLEADRKKWTAEQDQFVQELAGRRKSLDHYAVHLERLQHELSQKQIEWQGRQQQLDTHLARLQEERQILEASVRDRTQELDRSQGEFERERAVLDDLRRQLDGREAALARRQADLDGRIAELDEAQAEFQRARAALSAEQQALEHERTSTSSERGSLQSEWRRLENERRIVENQNVHITALRARCEEELAGIDAQRHVLALRQGELDQKQTAMAAESAVFEVHRQALVNERLEWQAETAQAEALWNGRQQHFDEQLKNFDHKNAELVQQRAAFEKQQATYLQKFAAFEQQSVLLDEREQSLFERLATFQTERNEVENLRSRLDERQAELQQRTAGLEQRENAIGRAESDLRVRQDAAVQIDQRLAERHQSLNEQQLRLDEQRNSLDQRRTQLEAERQSLSDGHANIEQEWRALNEARAALDADRLALESERNTLANDKQAWESEQQQRQQFESENAQRLTEQEANVASQNRQLAETAAQLARATADVEQQKKDLDAVYAELASERKLRADERQKFEAQYAARIDDLQAELALSSTQVQQVAAANELEQHRYEKRVAELSTRAEELHHKTQAMADERDRLQDERRRLENDRQSLAGQFAEERAQLNRERQALEQRLALQQEQAQTERDAINARREVLEILRHQPLSPVDSTAAESCEPRAPQDHSHVSEVHISITTIEDSDDAPTPALASNELSRLPIPALLKADDAAIDEDRETSHEIDFEDGSATSNVDLELTKSILAVAQSKADDEAIDDYMTRLLNRVRGTDAEQNKAPSSSAPYRAALRDDESDTEEPESEASSQVPIVEAIPSRLIPRTLAPELSSDLQAMRELANFSARTAIDQHTYKNWGRAAIGKLAIAVLATGAGAAALLVMKPSDPLLTYAGWTAIVIAVFWLLQAGILTCNVMIAKRSWKLDDDDSTAYGDHGAEHSSEEHGFAANSDEPHAEVTQVGDGEEHGDAEVVLDSDDDGVGVE